LPPKARIKVAIASITSWDIPIKIFQLIGWKCAAEWGNLATGTYLIRMTRGNRRFVKRSLLQD